MLSDGSIGIHSIDGEDGNINTDTTRSFDYANLLVQLSEEFALKDSSPDVDTLVEKVGELLVGYLALNGMGGSADILNSLSERYKRIFSEEDKLRKTVMDFNKIYTAMSSYGLTFVGDEISTLDMDNDQKALILSHKGDSLKEVGRHMGDAQRLSELKRAFFHSLSILCLSRGQGLNPRVFELDVEFGEQKKEILPNIWMFREEDLSHKYYSIAIGTSDFASVHYDSTESAELSPYQSYINDGNSLETDSRIMETASELFKQKYPEQSVMDRIREYGSFHEQWRDAAVSIELTSLVEAARVHDVSEQQILDEWAEIVKEAIENFRTEHQGRPSVVSGEA